MTDRPAKNDPTDPSLRVHDLGPGVDPEDLATLLRVLEQLPTLDGDHPDIQVVNPAEAEPALAI